MSFLLEAADPGPVTREAVGQKLESDLAPQSCVLGEVNVSHSARAKQVNDLVRPDILADHSGSIAGDQFGCDPKPRCFDEAFGSLVRLEQRLYLRSKGGIPCASVRQEGSSLLAW